MTLNRLTVPEMIQVSEEWVRPLSDAHKAIQHYEALAALLPLVKGARESLLTPAADTANPALATLMAMAGAEDLEHDAAVRGVFGLLTALSTLSTTRPLAGTAWAERLGRLLPLLLPEGLGVTQRTYRGEAGEAELLAARIEASPEAQRLLDEILVLGVPLRAFVDDWIACARTLGKLEAERPALEATPADGQGARQVQARHNWVRKVSLFLETAKEVEITPKADEVIFGQLRLAVAIAERRKGRSESPPPDPAPSTGSEPTSVG